jgi:Domain of unknown function (DUF5054)
MLKFMLQSWIANLYIDCPPGIPGLECPTPAEVANFTDSVKQGFFTWHAYPFNSELELHDTMGLQQGIESTRLLDSKFSVRPKTVVSQRDVPGTTRAVLPLFAGQGIRAMTIGVNGASTPPLVPRAFIWKDLASNVSMPMMVHPAGYGGISFEDAVVIPGLDTAVVFDWRGDNAGPYDNVNEAAQDWITIKQAFPSATSVECSTLEDWVDAMTPALKYLPVITSEIGDTWIHGCPSDPVKLAMYKVGQTVVHRCVDSGACSNADPVFANFTRLFLKNAEHTWGRDVKTYLHDAGNWTNAQLQTELAKNASNFALMVSSWNEQRAYGFDYPLQALDLGGHPLAAQLRDAFSALPPPAVPPSPPSMGFAPMEPGQVYNAGRFSIAFDLRGISHLSDSVTGQVWADSTTDSVLGYVHYTTYDANDFTNFINEYFCCSGSPPSWYLLDFGKPNVSLANPVHQELDSSIISLWMKEDKANGNAIFMYESVVLDAQGSDSPHVLYGAPLVIWTTVVVPLNPGTGAASIELTVDFYNKTATRLPEALFIRFNTTNAASSRWTMDKLGSKVDPFDVVSGGNQHHHGVLNSGVTVTENGQEFSIASPNAAIAAFGKPSGFPTSTRVRPELSEGASYMLWNNLWGTNYVMWFPFIVEESNLRYTFSLHM